MERLTAAWNRIDGHPLSALNSYEQGRKGPRASRTVKAGPHSSDYQTRQRAAGLAAGAETVQVCFLRKWLFV
jgi:hypothetical protein